MQLSQRQILFIGIVVVAIGATVFFIFSSLKSGSSGGIDDLQTQKSKKLSVWGIDDPRAFATIKKNFEGINKTVVVNYSQIDESIIQDQLVNALALNQGPDVVMIKNRTLAAKKSLFLPAPAAKMSFSKLQSLFPTVVEQDFTDKTRQVYALPLSIDTLALVYNKDFFDQARIITPPKTWSDLIDIIPNLVEKGDGGRIERAAIGLGGSTKSVTNAGDILALLYMQNGVNLSLGKLERSTVGRRVFDFYLQFSNPRSLSYTWSDLQLNDIDSLATLRSAMALMYARQLENLKVQSPYLHYGIAAMPQFGSAVDYADYWGLAVTRDSKNAAIAWDFVTYATTVSENALSYMKATKQPPALRNLLQSNYDSPEFGVFAKQALTARSWAVLNDDESRIIFSDMISSYLTGQMDQDAALGRAENLLSRIIVKK
ncbi:MAG: extracellular solute-binding protein [Patescibacteria group bacterium]